MSFFKKRKMKGIVKRAQVKQSSESKMGSSSHKRSIATVYHCNNRIVKVNRSSRAFYVIPTCIRHMQIDEYGANLAEIYNTLTGKLYAIIRKNVKGEIKILFKCKIQRGE
jgi:hypothetical protein